MISYYTRFITKSLKGKKKACKELKIVESIPLPMSKLLIENNYILLQVTKIRSNKESYRSVLIEYPDYHGNVHPTRFF